MKNCVIYYEQGVRVGPAAYGLGVFTLRAFSAREVLGPIEGRIFQDEAYESDYCMELGAVGCIEPDAPFRFLNHSCQPNCCLMEYEIEHEDGTCHQELWLSVEAAIVPGEQMTIDYGWPAECAIPCRCGSPACRQWIVAADQLEQISKKVAPGGKSLGSNEKQLPYVGGMLHGAPTGHRAQLGRRWSPESWGTG